MELFGAVKGFYFLIISKKKLLHKSVFVIFFRIGFQKALYLADSQSSDGGNAVTASPHNKNIGRLFFIQNFIKAAAGVCHNKSVAFSEFTELFF